MALQINYGSDIVVLPGEAAEGARDDDLYVLTMICRLSGKVSDKETLIRAIAAKSGRDETEIAKSVDHWENKNIFFFSDSESPMTAAVTEASAAQKQPLEMPDRRPQYTGNEAAKIIDGTAGMRELINECQLAAGKIFNASEVTAILSLSDYLRFTNEYIITLVQWCCSTGHKSMRYIEKTAYNLFDDGISSVEALSAHIERLESERTAADRMRRMMSLGDRELTKKETALFRKWLYEWEMSFEVIEKSYEITIDGTKDHKLSYEYMNKVLENWHSSGVKTLGEAERLINRYETEKKNSQSSGGGSSFDTDEFFELALKRSFDKIENTGTEDGKEEKT